MWLIVTKKWVRRTSPWIRRDIRVYWKWHECVAWCRQPWTFFVKQRHQCFCRCCSWDWWGLASWAPSCCCCLHSGSRIDSHTCIKISIVATPDFHHVIVPAWKWLTLKTEQDFLLLASQGRTSCSNVSAFWWQRIGAWFWGKRVSNDLHIQYAAFHCWQGWKC